MQVPMEFVAIFFTTILGAIGWVLKDIRASLARILEHLATLNGRVGKGETWQAMHEKQDDDRFENIEKQTDAIWTAVRGQ